jgi:hypothetical protein
MHDRLDRFEAAESLVQGRHLDYLLAPGVPDARILNH